MSELARALRIVATELERNPELARRVAGAVREAAPEPSAPEATAPAARRFRPRVITGADPVLGPGIPDPFTLRARLGEDGLRAALESLRIGSLRAIIREHRLDPEGHLAEQRDADRLRAHILAASAR